MAIAKTEEFWNHRLNGEDPTSPTGENNTAWSATGSGASEVDKYWVVTDARYNVTPTTNEYTILPLYNTQEYPTMTKCCFPLITVLKKWK